MVKVRSTKDPFLADATCPRVGIENGRKSSTEAQRHRKVGGVKTGETKTVIRHLQTLFEGGSLGGLSDAQLLDRFVDGREAVACEGLVHRAGEAAVPAWRGAPGRDGRNAVRPGRRPS